MPAAHDVRIAVLSPYWSFFETSVPFALRPDRQALGQEVADLVAAATGARVEHQLVDSVPAGAAAAAQLEQEPPDAVVVASSLCVPPAFVLAALDAVPDVPLLVLAVTRHAGCSQLSHAAITAGGATVGTPMLTNVLARRGRRHAVGVVVLDGDRGPAVAMLRALAAAGALRRARLLRVGRPIDGYDCVDVDPAALLAATGIELVDVPPDRLRDAYLGVGDAEVAVVDDEARRTFTVEDSAEGLPFTRSVRFAAALARLGEDRDADGGAVNCHGPELRFADEPGITPCFALGRETSRGRPWSCAGDAVTAVAMLALKRLGHAAQYHEVEALDPERGEALLATSGEHDLAFADPAVRPSLVRNAWWSGDAVCGACARFAPPAGPASLVAFTPHGQEPSGFRFVVAEGRFVRRDLSASGTVHAAFRFGADERLPEAWLRWVQAGVNHHSAATPGHAAAAVEALAAHLGVGCVITTTRST